MGLRSKTAGTGADMMSSASGEPANSLRCCSTRATSGAPIEAAT